MPTRSKEDSIPNQNARIWDNRPGSARDIPPTRGDAPVLPPLRAGEYKSFGQSSIERGTVMDDETQQRVITLVAAGIAYGISHTVTNRYIDVPDQRGVKDDILEAVLKGATTATSTILASILVRRVLAGRWS